MTTQEQFNNAEDQWQWVLQNKEKVKMITLDNDNTMITFVDDVDAYGYFDSYIGQSKGTLDLLDALGLPAEFC